MKVSNIHFRAFNGKSTNWFGQTTWQFKQYLEERWRFYGTLGKVAEYLHVLEGNDPLLNCEIIQTTDNSAIKIYMYRDDLEIYNEYSMFEFYLAKVPDLITWSLGNMYNLLYKSKDKNEALSES